MTTQTQRKGLARILDGRNIALIYIFSMLAYIAYYAVLMNQDLVRTSVPFFVLAAVAIIIEALLFIIPAVVAIVGAKQKTLHPVPCVLTVIAVAILLFDSVYFIVAGSFGDPVLRLIRSFPTVFMTSAMTISILYGFAAFAIKSESAKIKAAKIFGALHAALGLVMTIFYYGVYRGMQAYDYLGVVKLDVWYYSPLTLIIGFGIWAVVGLIAGVLVFTDRQKS